MGVKLGLVTETFSPAEDQSWLGSQHGTTSQESITLDADKFLTAFPTGIVPSGVVLGKNTSSGMYEPYANKSETASIAVDATGGTFTITINGVATAAIAFNATAAAVKAAIALPENDINPDDITVTGGPGAAGGATPYVITWSGSAWQDTDAPAVTTSAASLTGGAATATVTTVAGGASLTGVEVARGLLFTTQDLHGTTAGTALDTPAALLWHGRVIIAKLPTGHGLDASAQADLKQIRFV